MSGPTDEIVDLRTWLNSPDAWEAIAAAIGPRDYTYDLGDSSHRVDLAQIICEVALRVAPQFGSDVEQQA